MPKSKKAPCQVHNKCTFARRATWLVFKMSFFLCVQFLGDIAHSALHNFKGGKHTIAIEQFLWPDKNKMDFKNSVVENFCTVLKCCVGNVLRVLLDLLQVLEKRNVSNQARQGFS